MHIKTKMTHTHAHKHVHTYTHTPHTCIGDAYQRQSDEPENKNERTLDAEASIAALRKEQILKSNPCYGFIS